MSIAPLRPPRTFQGGTFSTTMHVTVAASKIWWRRLARSLGVIPSILLCLLCLAGIGGFWGWVWPPIADTVRGFLSGNREIDGVLFVSVLLSYAMLCSVVRVLMLAFDTVSRDMRLILGVAPLSRAARAAIQVLPDFGASTAVSVLLGSVTLVAYASANSRFSVGEAVVWAVAVVALVGCVAAGLELLFTRLTRDNMASRGGAAIVTLGMSGALTASIAASLRIDLQHGTTAALGAALLDLPTAWSLILGATVGGSALLLWCLCSSLTTTEIFRSAHRRRWIHAAYGGFLGASAMSFLRDAGNRLGLVGVATITGFAVWVESSTRLAVGGLACAMALCLITSAATIFAYGDYRRFRWRTLVSPARRGRVLLDWLSGHLLAAALVSGVPAGILIAVLPSLVQSWTAETVETLAFALVVGLSSGAVAGRVLPYDSDDMFSVFGSGLLAAVIGAVMWWTSTVVADWAHAPRLALAAVLLVIAVALVLRAEHPPRRVAPLLG